MARDRLFLENYKNYLIHAAESVLASGASGAPPDWEDARATLKSAGEVLNAALREAGLDGYAAYVKLRASAPAVEEAVVQRKLAQARVKRAAAEFAKNTGMRLSVQQERELWADIDDYIFHEDQ